MGETTPIGLDAKPVSVSLGYLHFYLIRIGNAINDQVSLYDVFDVHTETSEVGAAIFHPAFTDYRVKVRRRFQDVGTNGDILYLDQLTIKPFACGQRLGLSVLERAIRDWSSGCSLVIVKPYPTEPAKPPAASRISRTGLARLRAYYEALGFERIGQSMFYALCPVEMRPTAADLDLPDAVTIPIQHLEESTGRLPESSV